MVKYLNCESGVSSVFSPKKDMHASFAKMRGNLMNSVVVLVTKNLAKTRNAWQNKPE